MTTEFSPQRLGFRRVLLCTQIMVGFLLLSCSTFLLCSSLPCSCSLGLGLLHHAGCFALGFFEFSSWDIGRRSEESRGETLVYFCLDSTFLWRHCIAGSSHVSLKLHLRAVCGFWLWLAPRTVFSSFCPFCPGVLTASHWCWPLGASTPLVVS